MFLTNTLLPAEDCQNVGNYGHTRHSKPKVVDNVFFSPIPSLSMRHQTKPLVREVEVTGVQQSSATPHLLGSMRNLGRENTHFHFLAEGNARTYRIQILTWVADRLEML